ncbi:helix-turn-helix transcriptional regulator [Paraburkholderia sp. RP-4-7]|jgi:DNA-binding CsgD family transcriptional regulator|uniref:Helix-turn-helix transcriptional regulator n=1 Tax=Paraburkholderia polaris TaxID=2728848 RepID=A0A848IQA9_9BURK|nr:helix-turn-helix transcriptional regulator [Paraburkholderia polaris]NMM03420.1 helix-turn-helix transcriptional regulator [Paraburkholderia polaris]
MRSWRVSTPPRSGHINTSRVTDLVMSISHADPDALAASILKTVGDTLPVSQCTIFAYEFDARPRTVSAADHRGGRFLRDVADRYATHFYALDGNRAIVGRPQAKQAHEALVLHQQQSEEIENEAYRAACYAQPNVSDRLSLLLQPMESVWLSINLYRDSAYGMFQPGELEHVESVAHLFAHAAKGHYALNGQHQQGTAAAMLARVRRACPALTPREIDVLRGTLEGASAAEIAEQMGIKATSVITYQKRAYARLGISTQRQLFALCLLPERS